MGLASSGLGLGFSLELGKRIGVERPALSLTCSTLLLDAGFGLLEWCVWRRMLTEEVGLLLTEELVSLAHARAGAGRCGPLHNLLSRDLR